MTSYERNGVTYTANGNRVIVESVHGVVALFLNEDVDERAVKVLHTLVKMGAKLHADKVRKIVGNLTSDINNIEL
jgi:hypothetical protein